MPKYVWESKAWPIFTWDDSKLLRPLAEARKLQGQILGQAKFLQLKDQAEILVEETISTSAIEGEKLDRNSVRSSVARRLGLPVAGLPESKRSTDGIVEMLIDATAKQTAELNEARLFGWQASLFPTGYSGISKIEVGQWRKGEEPMQVVSGRMKEMKVHYEAPPSKKVAEEMQRFISWWNAKLNNIDGILRAGVAHFWFVTIHPFEDGNGRIARAITDMAIAQDEKTSMRLYSLSAQISKERQHYYDVLEATQKGSGDITPWLVWFLEMYARSIQESNKLIEKVMWIAKFYTAHEDRTFNERQKKVIRKLIEYYPAEFEGGLTTKKYVSITRSSPATAKRDMQELLDCKVLLPNEGGGRSTSYRLNVAL